MKLYRIRELREGLAMTQQELADRAQLSRTTVVRIENDQIGARPPIIKRLARALKVKPAVLIRDPAAAETTSPTPTPSVPTPPATRPVL
jgi:transcriptional regulator with XRE-family HTH domain